MIDWFERRMRLGSGLVDILFYDLVALSDMELLQVAEAKEGEIIVVSPGFGMGEIPVYSTVDAFMEACGGPGGVDTLVIAGVGSSAAGTAALAKNVANVLERRVAGIVSSLGWRDVFTHGIKGLTAERLSDRVDSTFQFWSGLWREVTSDLLWGQMVRFRLKGSYVEGIPESEILMSLLRRNQNSMRTLVGHSKGGLSIANALFGLRDHSAIENPHLNVVTFGCGVNVPSVYQHVFQYIGTWDMLGITNTTAKGELWRGLNWVWFKGHDTNSLNQFHLPVVEILKELKPRLLGES
ncbi:MAG: hypothetical protein HQL66_00440 [Magnetococcales bacterium]|nr:hypothetical protein [Magnetococcales bacterium]